jgi:hypothetical protein
MSANEVSDEIWETFDQTRKLLEDAIVRICETHWMKTDRALRRIRSEVAQHTDDMSKCDNDEPLACGLLFCVAEGSDEFEAKTEAVQVSQYKDSCNEAQKGVSEFIHLTLRILIAWKLSMVSLINQAWKLNRNMWWKL